MNSIKIVGHWKNIEKTYIKIAGHWKEAVNILLRENGKWVNTDHLSPSMNLTLTVSDVAKVGEVQLKAANNNVTRTVSGKKVNFKSLVYETIQIVIGTADIESIEGFVEAGHRLFGDWKTTTRTPVLTHFDTSITMNMYGMFTHMEKVTTQLNLVNFDTSKVTNMSRMFSGVRGFDFNTGYGIENFNIESLTDANLMFGNTRSVKTALYDAILTKWSAQNFKHDVRLGMGTAKYSNTSAIIACRKKLTDAGWVISDGGHT